LVVAVLSAAANASFLLQFLLDPALGIDSSMVSELSAPGRPGSWMFRGSDLFQAATGLLLVVPLARRWRTPRWINVGLVVGPFLTGAGTVVQVLVPEPCAPSVDPTCSLRTGPDLTMVVHEATSAVAVGAAIGSILAIWWMHRRPADAMPWTPPAHAPAGAWTALVIAVVVAVIGLIVAAQNLLTIDVPHLGLLQRLQLLGLSAWTIWLGWLATEPRRTPQTTH
jgi:hypothetical protein